MRLLIGWLKGFWHDLTHLTHQQVTAYDDGGKIIYIGCTCDKTFYKRDIL